MSRQNKQMRKAALKVQITNLHKKGEKGPSKTKSLHGKDSAKRAYTRLTRGTKDMAGARKRNEGTKPAVSGTPTL